LQRKQNVPVSDYWSKLRKFSLLFQNSAGNIETDLFIESWKKVTTQSIKSSNQFKCISRHEILKLFRMCFKIELMKLVMKIILKTL
jgi:hypothetical protein